MGFPLVKSLKHTYESIIQCTKQFKVLTWSEL